MNKDELEAWAKIRDGLAMAAQAADDLLNMHTPTFHKATPPPAEAKADVYEQIPEGIRDYVRSVEEKGNVLLVKMKYVQADKFQEISTAMKAVGGHYVSDGANTHWVLQK